jgi:hypothetical protein
MHGLINRRVALATFIVGVLAVGIGFWARANWVGPGERSNIPVPAPTATAIALAPATPTTARPAPTMAPTVVPTPVNNDVVLEVSESDLDSELSERLVGQPIGQTPLGQARIQSVRAQLRDHRVRLSGNAAAGFVSTPFVILGTVEPQRGRPMVDVQEATVGGFLLPAAARVTLADMLQDQVDNMVKERAVNVRTIDIADGRMRLVGTPSS